MSDMHALRRLHSYSYQRAVPVIPAHVPACLWPVQLTYRYRKRAFACLSQSSQTLRSVGVQLISVEPSDPIVWPRGTAPPHFAPGSINMIHCNDQIFDARNWPVDDPVEHATMIILHCHMLFPDMKTPWVTTSLLYSTTSSFPCNVRPPLDF
jgi:hypothetical protein